MNIGRAVASAYALQLADAASTLHAVVTTPYPASVFTGPDGLKNLLLPTNGVLLGVHPGEVGEVGRPDAANSH
jgi:hypothetical protein